MAILKLTPIILKQINKYLTTPKKVRKFGFDEPPVKTGKDIERPQEALDREMFKEAQERFKNAKAGGGMLVQPGFGGTRQGYRSDKTQEVKIKNSLSSKQFAAKQNIYKIDGLRKLVGPASRKLPAYKVFIQALKNAGIDFTPSTGEGVAAKFENVNDETIKKFEKEVSKLKVKAGLPMSRVETENIKKQIKIF